MGAFRNAALVQSAAPAYLAELTAGQRERKEATGRRTAERLTNRAASLQTTTPRSIAT